MSSVLEISVLPGDSTFDESILFYASEHWNQESEIQMIQRIHDLLYMLRPFGKKLNICLQAEVTDVASAKFVIQKKLKKKCEINTQKLTSREVEIIGLIMEGLTNKEIAKRLFICFETVKSHRKHILLKTGAKNTAALINYYHQTFFEK